MIKNWHYWKIHKNELQKLDARAVEQITIFPLSEEALRFEEEVREKFELEHFSDKTTNS